MRRASHVLLAFPSGALLVSRTGKLKLQSIWECKRMNVLSPISLLQMDPSHRVQTSSWMSIIIDGHICLMFNILHLCVLFQVKLIIVNYCCVMRYVLQRSTYIKLLNHKNHSFIGTLRLYLSSQFTVRTLDVGNHQHVKPECLNLLSWRSLPVGKLLFMSDVMSHKLLKKVRQSDAACNAHLHTHVVCAIVHLCVQVRERERETLCVLNLYINIILSDLPCVCLWFCRFPYLFPNSFGLSKSVPCSCPPDKCFTSPGIQQGNVITAMQTSPEGMHCWGPDLSRRPNKCTAYCLQMAGHTGTQQQDNYK